MASPPSSSTANIGTCGEHYTAAYLSAHRFIVAMQRAGIPNADLYVSTTHDRPAVRVKVKAGTDSFRKTKQDGPIYLWHASKQAVLRVDSFLWYAFVWLRGWPEKEQLPLILFVSSAIVSRQVKLCHDAGERLFFWLPVDEASRYDAAAGLKPLTAMFLIENDNQRPSP